MDEGPVWQVDEDLGRCWGPVTADVQPPYEDHRLDNPAWVGEDITGDTRYSSSTLSAAVQTVHSVRTLSLCDLDVNLSIRSGVFRGLGNVADCVA
jgi:hypothetical protein